ncbi:hypothetical protein [Photobacterium rosenbergii]|uniref:Replication-associated protein ORF2/G2P domain-containing protein n=1 Tax=Photobacterium rosenbergii TaxID=294936 RepID=A0ABU3ZBN1_9GAMM|nr:hypothetical protein [Photobacterium rosenbergii]MDV5167500.1 hypothetical protein [Photobacterium rosenbergii]
MLPINDLLYVAGAVQPHDITQKNIASHEAGFFGSNSAEWLKHEQQKLNQFAQLHYVRTKGFAKQGRELYAEHTREAAARSDGDNRLVQGRKSPTHPKVVNLSSRVGRLRKAQRRDIELVSTESHYNHERLYDLPDAPSDKRLSTVRLMHREWSGSYRILHHTQTRPGDAPDPQSGERYTEKLTQRAVTKIFESGAYVAACEGGFTTFLTLTFTMEQRNAIFGGETTLGREVSRFLDGIKKMFQRGWQGIDADGEQFELDGIEEPFHYIWVAECPANEHGEPNPHVHLIMNWQVDKQHFQAWSERLEGIWGNGFAHLERIRQPKAAGSYIIKAVGYAAKGENADQGLIKGNRYNIARCSRAPGWDCLANFEAHNMAAIIKECGYRLEHWKKPLQRSLYRLEKKKEQAIKAKAIAKKAKRPKAAIQKLTALIARLEGQQQAINNQIKDRGIHASTKNRFCLSFEGEEAEDKAYDFLLWAAGARGWSMQSTDDDPDYHQNVSEARATAQREYRQQYQRFLLKQAYWKSVLNDPLAPNREEPTELELSAAKADLEWYQNQQLAA